MAKKKEKPGVVEYLRQFIRDSGLSLNQLSASSGIDKGRISRFLRGERDITASALDKLCQALDLALVHQKQPPAS